MIFIKDVETIQTKEIIKATGGKLLTRKSHPSDEEQLSHSFHGISIDSRTITEGELFFALRGERFDGHKFLEESLLRGDGAVIDSHPYKLEQEKIIIYVDDTLKALQDLAHFLRMRRNIPVVAITGSNGKTTTKEMAYAILSQKFKVLKNEGNLNNHIGLPLSLAKIASDDEAVVLELGMNAPGEIRRLCDIAVPSHGVVTNIGSAHIGRLGDLDAVRKAKLEILKGLSVAILNADDTFLMQGYESIKEREGLDCKLVTFSLQRDSHITAEDVVATEDGSTFTLRTQEGETREIRLRVHGLFNVCNALAASAIGLTLGVHIDDVKRALDTYHSFPMRFEVIRGDNLTIINDAYNANPSSMEEVLKEFVLLSEKRRAVAVLGDMSELGVFAEQNHKYVGKKILDTGIDVFIAVGPRMKLAALEIQKRNNKENRKTSKPLVYTFQHAEEAAHHISEIIEDDDFILIKGSRVMGMEKILERMRA